MGKTWSSSKSQGFAPVVIVLIVAGSIIGALIYAKFGNNKSDQSVAESPSPDPYQDWKTYQNQNLGFSLRYPKEWYARQYQDYAANFIVVDPKVQEASPSAVRIRFNKLSESIDLKTFEKIYNLKPDETFYESLDVRSKVVKIRNFDTGPNRAVEYTIDRTFSALEGPKTEYSHVYEIARQDVILKFSASATTREEQSRGDGIFQQIIASLKF